MPDDGLSRLRDRLDLDGVGELLVLSVVDLFGSRGLHRLVCGGRMHIEQLNLPRY